MLKKILCSVLLISFFINVKAQEQSKTVLLINFPKDNISWNKNMQSFIENRDISKESMYNRIAAASRIALKDVTQQYNFNVKGLEDQISLLSSEFTDLVKKQSIDKVSEKKDKKLLQKLTAVFQRSAPKHYMSAKFSEDKLDRIKTTLEQQNSSYAIIVHKYDIQRAICGETQMITHFSVVNKEAEIILGAQQIYYVDIKGSMKTSILNHLIESGFADTFGIIFDKIK